VRKSFAKKLLALVMVVSLGLALGGCTVRIAYNQLDWLIPWYLEDYFEPQGEQKALFAEQLHVFLNWHRAQQLPQYADFLEQVASWAEVGLQPENIDFVQARSAEFAETLLQRLAPEFMRLLVSSTEKQVNLLFEQLDLDNQDFREDYIEDPPQAQRKARSKEVTRYVQRWTGKLNREQRQLIENWSQQYLLMGEELLQSRLAWQQQFARVLQMRHDPEAYQQAFMALSGDSDYGQSDLLKSKLEQNGALLLALYYQLDHSLTPKQRKRMVSKLRRYAKDFRVLSLQEF
jgi:hypothetical protein